jgi:hypothetical protein
VVFHDLVAVLVINGITVYYYILFPLEVGTMGEVLIIHNISRSCGGTYQCMAFNEVLPAIAKQIEVEVQCEY